MRWTRAEMEMEAAEALAGLAHGVSGRKRRTGNGKRRRKLVAEEEEERQRVEVESSPVVDSWPTRPDLVQEMNGSNTGKLKMGMDDPASPHQECAPALRNVDVMQMKTEQDSVFPDSQSQMCSTSYLPLGGGRSRHNLSEDEKEAKRIRRVLANRESARRTIRRRQALCEDLTSKAAELIEENQRLKKKTELALKENESLETTNKNLKAKIVSTKLKPAALGNTHRVHSSANGNCHEGASSAPQLTPSITALSLCCGMGNIDESSSQVHLWNRGIDLPPVTAKAEPPEFIVGDLNELPIKSPPLGSSSDEIEPSRKYSANHVARQEVGRRGGRDRSEAVERKSVIGRQC